ncbi:hypothetical protein L6164_001443 [Bauhinia variegata]|uniref:Uncharacterized protein n=1 Tax=Bauhinia variegata TaxID=167791 RepID=A0ACB9QBQ8_BAUVA|nr:hypothetical protein L6164_001443 [Bauhinia variegata]
MLILENVALTLKNMHGSDIWALQDGVKETGVSLGFTVHELDAGPIIAREVFQVDDQIKRIGTYVHVHP